MNRFIDFDTVNDFAAVKLNNDFVNPHGSEKSKEFRDYVITRSEPSTPIPMSVFKACYDRALVKVPMQLIPESCDIIEYDHANEDVIEKARQEIYNKMVEAAEKKTRQALALHSTIVTSCTAADTVDECKIEIMTAELGVLTAQKELTILKETKDISSVVEDSEEIKAVIEKSSFGIVNVVDFVLSRPQCYGITNDYHISGFKEFVENLKGPQSFYDCYIMNDKKYFVYSGSTGSNIMNILTTAGINGCYPKASPPEGVIAGHKYHNYDAICLEELEECIPLVFEYTEFTREKLGIIQMNNQVYNSQYIVDLAAKLHDRDLVIASLLARVSALEAREK